MKKRALLLGAATLIGCSGETPSENVPPNDDSVATKTSYLRDIQPIIERSCQTCHVDGGIAPFELSTPEQVVRLSALIWPAIEAKTMPPFMAGDNCSTYSHDIRLAQDEIDMIKEWVDEGAPMGDPKEERHAEAVDKPTIRHDLPMDLGGMFDATIMRDDNYRCFVLDPNLSNDLDITGYQVIPGNKAIVHHVLAYSVAPDRVAELDQMDADEPGMGYTCFGGPGIRNASQIAAWVPGQVPRQLPAGTAFRIEAGSKIVMQVHYNLLAAEGPPLDNTQLMLQTQAVGQAETAISFPLAQPTLNIQAGDDNARAENMFRIRRGLGDGATIYAVTGHMHQLGKAIKLDVVHADGSSTCLLDIPRWDFDWQQSFELVRPVTLTAGDTLRIRCAYDNSQANQPIINGEQQAPRDVQWGEGSLDEMCLGYLYTTLRQ